MFTKIRIISLIALFGCILGAPSEHSEWKYSTTELPIVHTTEYPTAHTTEILTEHSTDHSTEYSTQHSSDCEHSTEYSTEYPTAHTTEISPEHSTDHSTEYSTQHSSDCEHSTEYPTAHTTEILTEHSTERIVDGTPINISKVPWQVSLQIINGTYHFCGGAIISDRWILTAAHCLKSRDVFVRVGATHPYLEGVLIDVEETFQHPNYRKYDYDFGLIKLKTPIEFNDNVKTISLPKSDDEYVAGTECLVAGWGRTTEGGAPSKTLLGVKVPIVDHGDCRNAYSAMIPITPRMICAGYPEGGQSTCQGDSGGPLVSFKTGNPVVIGCVSFAKGCAEPKYPTVFARVQAVREWIHSLTGI